MGEVFKTATPKCNAPYTTATETVGSNSYNMAKVLQASAEQKYGCFATTVPQAGGRRKSRRRGRRRRHKSSTNRRKFRARRRRPARTRRRRKPTRPVWLA